MKYSSKELVKMAKKYGWDERKAGTGTHRVYINPKNGKHVTIPLGKKEIHRHLFNRLNKELKVGAV